MEPGKVVLKGEPIDLGRITLDIYAVGAEKDHIVPWDAAWRITQLTAARCAMCWPPPAISRASSIRPAARAPIGRTRPTQRLPQRKSGGRARARHEGSWWTDWTAWLAERSGAKGKPPSMGGPRHKPLQDAPGSYVLEK